MVKMTHLRGHNMSTYPVRLSEWFPPGDEMYDNASAMVHIFKCYACGKKPRWKAAVGHHSIPWGNGDIWCSWKCCNSDKVYELDKRQQRSQKRRLARADPNMPLFTISYAEQLETLANAIS